MPLMIKLNRVMQVPDSEVETYMSNGFRLYAPEKDRQNGKRKGKDASSGDDFQAAVAAEVEKRVAQLPTQADFEAAVAAEVERRLAEQPPPAVTEDANILHPPDEEGAAKVAVSPKAEKAAKKK